MSNTPKLTDEQREELRKDIESFMVSTLFNFDRMNEPNRIKEARNIIERLQSSEQAWKEQAEHWIKATKHWSGRFDTTVDNLIKTQEQLNQAKEVLKRIGSIVSQDPQAIEASGKANEFLFSSLQEDKP